MRTVLIDDLQVIDDVWKTAVIDRELHRLNIDTGNATPREWVHEGETLYLFWQGKGTEEAREHDVGSLVRHTLLHMIEPPTDGTERILTPRLSSMQDPVNLVCTYAPTLQASSEIKDQFYE